MVNRAISYPYAFRVFIAILSRLMATVLDKGTNKAMRKIYASNLSYLLRLWQVQVEETEYDGVHLLKTKTGTV